MSDKDKTERKVFKEHFPDAKLMICLFHVFQIFNREVSFKKMGITSEEVQTSKQYLQKLAYSLSESEYNDIYHEMVTKVPEVVKHYYDSNWACIAEQWIQYLTLQNLCFTNKTNNRLESINSKLKSVINRYSPLEDFIKHLFVYINSCRVGKDVKNSQMLSKKLARAYKGGSDEHLYCEHLTFVFEKVAKQLQLFKSYKEFESIGNNIFLAVTSEGLLQVSPLSCDCLFRKSTQLPCRHIFKCRSTLLMPLFDINLCLSRWTRSYCEQILDDFATNKSDHGEHIEIESGNVSDLRVAQLNDSRPKYMTNHTKFKLMDEQGKKIAQLCSEVSTRIFRKKLKIIETITKCWEEGQDAILVDILKSGIFENNEQVQEEDKEKLDGENENEALNEHGADVNLTEVTIGDPNCNIEESENEAIEEFLVSSVEQDEEKFSTSKCDDDLRQSEHEVIIEYIIMNNNVKEITGGGIQTQCENAITSKYVVTNAKKLEEETTNINTRTDEREQHLQHRSSNTAHPNSSFREGKIDIDEEENRFQQCEEGSILQNIKMPNTIKIRGRPKGSGNTVIGLKRKRKRPHK